MGSARRKPYDFFIRHAFVDENCQFFIYWEFPMNFSTKLRNFNSSGLPPNEPIRGSCDAHQLREIEQVNKDEVIARMQRSVRNIRDICGFSACVTRYLIYINHIAVRKCITSSKGQMLNIPRAIAA